MESITSRNNSRVKAVHALHRKQERTEQGLFLIEGPRNLDLAFEADWPVSQVFFEDRFLQTPEGQALAARSGHAECLSVPSEVMARLSTTDSPCPVMAVARQKRFGLDVEEIRRDGLYLVAHRTSDPGNLGTLLRIAVAAGAEALFLTGDACELYNPKVVRSSMGALFHLKVFVEQEILNVFEVLKKAGIPRVAAVPGAKLNYADADYRAGAAFVLGEESQGLESALSEAVDVRVSIPVLGPVQSLNVAISGAVLLYEALRQRGRK